MKKISLIILHYSNKELTFRCLESVRRLETPDFKLQVIVVNNNPQENLSDLKKKFGDFAFIKTERNLGYAEGNNAGIRQALKDGADYIVLLNNDTEMAKDFMVQLIKVAETKKKAGILAPKIYFAPGYEFHQDRYQKSEQGKVIWFAGGRVDWANIATPHLGVDEVDQGQYDQIKKTEFISGCAMMVKREVLEKIGLLEGKYFLYFEDADFCQRAMRAGFALFYVPAAKVWHKVAASSEIGGDLHDYFMVRNQLLFGWRFAPLRAKLALIKQSLRFLLFGRLWQKKGVVDFYLNKFGQGSWGRV